MTASIRCPKCGRENEADAVICAGCDFILDTSFLGDDITDERGGAERGEEAPGSFGGDALILGKPSGEAEDFASFESEQTGDFLSAPTAAGVRALSPSMVYVDAETKALLEPDAVLGLRDGVDAARLELSPFEQHVINFIDGNRPVARIGALSGLSDEDLRICLLLIADKGALRRVGTATRADSEFDEPTTTTVALATDRVAEVLPPHLGGPTEAVSRSGAFLTDHDLAGLEGKASEPAGHPSPFVGAEPAPTNERPLTLPSEFLTPIAPAPKPTAAATPAAPAVTQPRSGVPALPGGVPPLPGGVPPLPGAAPLPGQAAKTAPPSPPAPRAKANLVIKEPDPPPAPEARAPPPGPVKPAGPKTAAQKKAEQLYDLAISDIRANKMARALGYARMAHEIDPADARYKELVDDWQNAKQIASRGDNAPEDVKLYNQAKMAEAEGNIDQALAALEKAIKVNPRAAALQNQMGVLLATKKKDFSRALTYLFRAVELDSNNAAYKNNLGKVLAMSGNTGPVSPLGGGDDKGGRWSKLKGKLF